MATFYTVLTEAGQAKLANAIALGETINITHLAVGDGNGSLPEPDTGRTALVNEVRRAQINRSEVDEDNPNWIVVEQVLPPDVGGWTIREIGVFDDEGDLIGYGNYPETYKPKLDEGSSRTQTIRFVMEVSDTAAVTLKVDPSVVLATRSFADDVVGAHAKETEGVHGIPEGESVIHTGLKATTQEAKDGVENKYPDAAGVRSTMRANAYDTQPPGVPFPVFDHLPGINPPSNSGPAKFIRLTAGEDGAGEYNDGLLINESVSGSGHLVEITAEIATGPSAGGVVNLLNSEKRYLMPGESSGATANDQMQQITGSFRANASGFTEINSPPTVDGVFSADGSGALAAGNGAGASTTATGRLNFDSADSAGARTGDHTNVKHVQATYYMRIA